MTQQTPLPSRQAYRAADPPGHGRWLLPGLIAGAAFLAVEVAIGAFTTTPWALPDAIAAVLGLGTSGYRFELLPVLVGIAAHLTVSIALGVLYLTIAHRLRLRRGWLVLGAWIFSGVETPLSLWGVLHTVLTPHTFHYFLDAVPFWASFLGRNTYGLVLGLLAWRMRSPTRDGPGRNYAGRC
jgi:hypothetical protein